MNDPRTEKYKAVASRINEVLYEDWAPIGFCGLPRDEYENYVPRVISLLASGVSESEIANYLAQTGQAITGSAYSEQQSLVVAKKLMLFQDEANAIPL
ncbi:MAG TPA: hypothetical protein PK667_05830 [Nitrosomonas europaea]|uniref:hypothetical protein n=1 Tax=Nitrosomonas europaea TaxID=915 RepID=UPI00248F8217|nr:hypothetical protein [Nitrosomonas europaea]HRN82096.1 hypothetical protein [Nitrosomonas europaea]HRO56091.1 hypothetical protein [Nitrosomonas europaea]HRQ08166.1 hypothetical protein [Nitrosomonas europaea]HUM73707.1 hypothetical protein [Nitrosomonas europaea]